MRAFRNSERGASAWPLVLAILLLLVAVYMLFDKTSQFDEQTKVVEETKAKHRQLQLKGAAIIEKLKAISAVVGFPTDNANVEGFAMADTSIPISDAAAIAAMVNPAGVIGEGENTSPSLAKSLAEDAKLTYTRTARLHTKTVGETKEVTADYATQAYLDKIQKMKESSVAIGNRPAPPFDTDDEAGMERFRNELAEFEQRVATYNASVSDLVNDPGYKQGKRVISGPGEFGPAESDLTDVFMYPRATGGANTLESTMKGVPAMIEAFKTEAKANSEAFNEVIKALRNDVGAKETAIADVKDKLKIEQTERQGEFTSLTDQLRKKESDATEANAERDEAISKLEKQKQDAADAISQLGSERDAYREGLANEKERRDHNIRRNVAKARVLTTSRLGNTVINIGRRDRAIMGLKLVAMAPNRAGMPVPRGEVMITQVIGPSSSKARIVSGDVRDGYALHNPLYGKNEAIRIYIHGTLEKWPMSILRSRLEALNVELQPAMNGKTDYVVIPNSLAAAPVKSGEDDEEEEADPNANVLEMIKNKARTFGASVVTERLFDDFLDY